jgi:hypothetical protein
MPTLKSMIRNHRRSLSVVIEVAVEPTGVPRWTLESMRP